MASGGSGGGPASAAGSSYAGGLVAGSNAGSASASKPLGEPAACPGDLTGEWASDDQVEPPAPDVDECWNLIGGFSAGTYGATMSYPRPKRRVFSLKLEPNVYQLAHVLTGRAQADFPAECLATEQGTPTCAQLGAALLLSGQGEGWVREATCSERAAGGCSCEFDLMAVGGDTGTYLDNPQARTVELMDTFEPSAAPIRTRYCVDDEGLRFGPEIDAVAPDVGTAVFHRVDCVDAVKGPGEEDVDCGIVCAPCVKTKY